MSQSDQEPEGEEIAEISVIVYGTDDESTGTRKFTAEVDTGADEGWFGWATMAAVSGLLRSIGEADAPMDDSPEDQAIKALAAELEEKVSAAMIGIAALAARKH